MGRTCGGEWSRQRGVHTYKHGQERGSIPDNAPAVQKGNICRDREGYGRAQTKQDTLPEANESGGEARGDRQPKLQPLQAERREDEPLV